MPDPQQLAKTLARDIADLDDLIDEALRKRDSTMKQREALSSLLRELPLQFRLVKTSLLAYADDANLSERIML